MADDNLNIPRHQKLQKQIDDTTGLLRQNVEKVAQRGERLDSLQENMINLRQSAQGFRRGTNNLRKKMWWKDMKMRMCLVFGGVILLIVIIVPIVALIKRN